MDAQPPDLRGRACAHLSAHGPAREQAADWLALADASSRTPRHGRCIRRAAGSAPRTIQRVDAALLLAGASAAPSRHDDPRSIATLLAVDRELTEDGYAYRYRPTSGRSETPRARSSSADSGWRSPGRSRAITSAAARWFERNRAACGPPGLFAEEFDVTQRQLRGNLPQAFVHALLLECAADQFAPDGDVR